MKDLHGEWARLLVQERPWMDNEVTRDILYKTNNKELSAVIWALMGNKSSEWISMPLPGLGNLSVLEVLRERGGVIKVWSVLEGMSAWM